MVKKIDLQTCVDGCSLQEFWGAVYAEAGPMKTYHMLVNKVSHSNAGAWKASNTAAKGP